MDESLRDPATLPWSVRKPVINVQHAYSYRAREIAIALGLPLTPQQWVVVEVDGETVDVMIREDKTDG